MSYPQIVRIALCSVALLGATFASAQETQADFASQTPLSLKGDGPWYRIELPLTVQLNSRQPDVGDVRVFDAQGQAQAYAIARQPLQSEQPLAPVSVQWFPLYSNAKAPDSAPRIRVERSASGTLVEVQPQADLNAEEQVLRGWLLDTSALKQPLKQLILDWSTEREGFQRFSIEASDDLQNWNAWGEGQVARLSFADQVVEQREVTLPSRTARYLRLLWNTPHSAPNLTSAQLLTASTAAAQLPLNWSQPLAGSVEKPGSYLWQLPIDLPVERLKIDIDQANSLAPGTAYGRLDSKAPWQAIGNGLLYRLTQNGEDVVQDEISTPVKNVRQLKLEVDERGGGLGTQAPALRFAVRAPQVVFLARGNGPFTLAIGNPAARPADLPLSTLIPDYSAEKMSSLGSAEPSGTPIQIAAPVPTAVSRINWKNISLWGVLVAGVTLLGWMALSMLRASPSTSRADTASHHRSGLPLLFERNPSGEWEALDGYYQAHFKGVRVGQEVTFYVNGKEEASFFVWSESSHEADSRGYTWTVGADPAAGEIRIGNETCRTLFQALSQAFHEPHKTTVVFDPSIRNTVLDRWGP